MKHLVLLQCPLGQHLRQVHVRAGAPSIEAATGLTPELVARLDDDDRAAIEKAMHR